MLQAQLPLQSLGSSRGAAAAPRRPSGRRSSLQVQTLAVREASSGTCPFAAASSALQGVVRQLGGTQQAAQPQRRGTPGSVQTPGPDPFSLQSLQDVGCIFTDGLHEAMLRFAARYGPVSRFSNPAKLNGASGWLFLNSPDDIAHVCATNTRNYSERYLPDIYSWVTHGKGLLGSQGDYNRRHRKLCGPPFRSADLLRSFGEVVVERSLRVADTFTSQPGPFATNVAIQTQRLTLDCVGLTAFSHDFGEVEAIARDVRGGAPPSASDQDRLLWAVNAFGQVLGQVFITPMPLLRLMDKLGFRQLRTLREALEVMRHSMLGVIAQRHASLAERTAAAVSIEGSASASAGAAAAAAAAVAPKDLLDMLLLATDENGVPMTDEELWEDVHDVMGAGHETTATTAAAAIYAVSAHPEVEARLVAELESVLGGRAPTYDDLEQLPYLAAVVKETLRLYPAIPIFPRCAAADDVLPSGHAVHAGESCLQQLGPAMLWIECCPRARPCALTTWYSCRRMHCTARRTCGTTPCGSTPKGSWVSARLACTASSGCPLARGPACAWAPHSPRCPSPSWWPPSCSAAASGRCAPTPSSSPPPTTSPSTLTAPAG